MGGRNVRHRIVWRRLVVVLDTYDLTTLSYYRLSY
jgi:hypothetical protein